MGALAAADPLLEALIARFGDEFALRDGPYALDALRTALAALDNPHTRLPPTLHIAGTNGKGSVAAFAAAIAAAAGLDAHSFTQPHLIRVAERFRLAGRQPDERALNAALERIAAAGPGLSQFEAQTALAFLAFSETPAALTILETGCGGLLDATNVIPSPAVCALTPIAMDHAAVLGDTLAEIAAHKAGIIKPGAIAVCARQEPPAQDVIDAACSAAGAPLLLEGRDWQAWPERDRLCVQTETSFLDLPEPALHGPHQAQNAGLAVVAMQAMPVAVSDAALAEGVARAVLPGRIQHLRDGPLAAAAPGVQVLLDGAHNPHAAAALAAYLGAQPRPTVLVMATLADKDASGMLKALAGVADGLVAAPLSGPRPATPQDAILAQAAAAGLPALAQADTLQEAVTRAARLAGPGGRVVICGSLALVGAALSLGSSDRPI